MGKPREHRPIIINEAVKKRFFEKIEKTDTCWNWTAAINPSGHGVMKVEGNNKGAHRLSYAIHYGEIPANLMILHNCHNAKCVNPAHLRAGTAEDNSQDEVKRQNTRHYKCTNASRFKGVQWDNQRKSWISYVYLNRKVVRIGRHVSEVDAARNHDRIKYMKYGISTDLNFPEEYNLSG